MNFNGGGASSDCRGREAAQRQQTVAVRKKGRGASKVPWLVTQKCGLRQAPGKEKKGKSKITKRIEARRVGRRLHGSAGGKDGGKREGRVVKAGGPTTPPNILERPGKNDTHDLSLILMRS